jgi:hypothetical protein
MTVRRSQNIKVTHRGVVPPSFMGIFGRKYFNILHRVNSFEMQVPIHTKIMPECIHERFNFIKIMNTYNVENLPHFMGLTSSLHVI